MSPESVWDYPRPPRLEATSKRLQVIFAGVTVADTTRGLRVLETSHPPTYYIPPEDVRADLLVPSPRTSLCEWKGQARYWTVQVGEKEARNVAWSYPNPTRDFREIRDHLAFYPGPMDACFVDGEEVRAQAGGFYGGWVTRDLEGPFKGEPGTLGW
jgi:uncharacterized protein (DUF427 family)